MRKWPWADIVTIIGLLLISIGVAWFSLAASVIVLGIMVAAIGIILDIAKRRERERQQNRRRSP